MLGVLVLAGLKTRGPLSFRNVAQVSVVGLGVLLSFGFLQVFFLLLSVFLFVLVSLYTPCMLRGA
jgi:hypothetical protein